MSDPEGFLTRWSRRKRQEEAPDAAAAVPAAGPGPEEPRDQEDAAAFPATQTEPPVPAVDLTKLPPLESITAETEIRDFLARGVPDQLKHAALRRAWSADPAIRDFIGLSENSWDFTAPDSMPGFGPLLSTDDVGRMVANLTRGLEPPSVVRVADSDVGPEPAESAQGLGAVAPSEKISATTESYPPSETVPAVVAEPPGEATEPNERPVDIAAQNQSHPVDNGTEPIRRGHGGAIPR
jgi:hypothetical protein